MLRFPNPSRSYDLTRRAVRFWGHDGAMEASFFVEAPALRIFQPKAVSEGELLAVSDRHRGDIHSTGVSRNEESIKHYGRHSFHVWISMGSRRTEPHW
jgi:hypothetical protein